jgi:hypothetical protein
VSVNASRAVGRYVNAWFIVFGPEAFRTTRIQTTKDVEAALHATRQPDEHQTDVLLIS